ncbi:hypothetical protein WDU94_003130 [Cyamophila willieti]
MIVSFINKIKTGGTTEDNSSNSKESSSSNLNIEDQNKVIAGLKQFIVAKQAAGTSVQEGKLNTNPIQQKEKRNQKLNTKNVTKDMKTNTKTDPKLSQPEFDEDGDVILTANQQKGIEKEPSIIRRRLLLKSYLRENMSMKTPPNRKRLRKVNVKSLLHVDVELIAKAKKVLKTGKGILGDKSGTLENKDPKTEDQRSILETSKTLKDKNTQDTEHVSIGKVEKISSLTNETNKDNTDDKIDTKGEKTNPVAITSSDKNDVESANTPPSRDIDNNNDNISKNDNESVDKSKDGQNIKDDKTTHGTTIDNSHSNGTTVDKSPSDDTPKQTEDDEIVVLEVPKKVFPVIDILSEDEDDTNTNRINKINVDQEDIMEINVDNELKTSIDQAGIEREDENSEYKQLALEMNASNVEKDPNIDKHLERNNERDRQRNPLQSQECDFDAKNKMKDSEGNYLNDKVSDESNATSLKRKNIKDDGLNENERKKRKDTDNNGKDTHPIGVEVGSHLQTSNKLEVQELRENNEEVLGNQVVESRDGLMSDQSRIQDSAILSLINEVKMSTRQQRKQESTSSSSHGNSTNPSTPIGSKPSIRDRLGDKLSIKDRIGPIDSSSDGSSSRLPIGGSRIRDRLGGKVLEEEDDDDDDEREGGGLAIRVQIENELVINSGNERDLEMTPAASLLHNPEDVPFIRQVLIEPSNKTDATNGDTRTHAQSRYLSPTRLEHVDLGYLPSPNREEPEDEFPMLNEAGFDDPDGFQTLSEAESEKREGGSDCERRRKRRSVKDRLGRKVDSSENEEQDRQSPSSRHHHRRHSESSRHRSRSRSQDRESRRYAHVSRYKLVRDRVRRDSSPSRRDKSRDSPSKRDSPGAREKSLERRRKFLERREKSLERREKESLNKRPESYRERKSRLKKLALSKYRWSRPDAERKEMERETVTSRSRDSLDDPSRSSRSGHPRNIGRNRWEGPAQPAPPRSNLIELIGQPGPPMQYGTPQFAPLMEHQIPPSFLDPTTMPMQNMSQQPPNMMFQQPFQIPPYIQPPPPFSQPPPSFIQQPLMSTNVQPPMFNPPSTPTLMGVPPPAMVPPPTMVPPPSAIGPISSNSGQSVPTDANFTYAFIEQNISKVKANLMNKIDTSRSKVDEYFEKFKVNEPKKDGRSGRKGQEKSGKHDYHHRRRSSSSEIRSVSPENRSTSSRSRSRSRSRLRRSQRNRDSRSRESGEKTSHHSLERRDSLTQQNASLASLQGQNSSSRNSVESRPTSPLNDRDIDVLYRDLIRRRNEEPGRPPSIVSVSPSPPLELGSRFRGHSPSVQERDRPSRFGLQEMSLLEHRDSLSPLPRHLMGSSGHRQRSPEYTNNTSISDLLSAARRQQQLASRSSRSPDLFTAPPANRPPFSNTRSPPLIRLRTPPPPSPPRYDRLPRPSRVQINLSPLRFSRSPSFEMDPQRHGPRRDLETSKPSSISRRPRSPLRLSPPNLRWSQSPTPPPTHPREKVWYSRSPEPSEGRQRYSKEHSQGREESFYGNRADATRYHPDETRRFRGNQDDPLQRPLSPNDARHLIHSRDERSMSFSISPSPDRRGGFSPARSSSSDFVNPLDLVDNPGIPGDW